MATWHYDAVNGELHTRPQANGEGKNYGDDDVTVVSYTELYTTSLIFIALPSSFAPNFFIASSLLQHLFLEAAKMTRLDL